MKMKFIFTVQFGVVMKAVWNDRKMIDFVLVRANDIFEKMKQSCLD